MKHTNFGPAPRSLSESVFLERGCAIERPFPRTSLLTIVTGWAVAVLVVWTGLWFLLTR